MTGFEEKLKHAKEICGDHPDEAMRICSEIMNADFDGFYGQMALFMTGYIMMEAERFGLAYHIYKRCEQLNPSVSEIYSNMGMCLEEHNPERAKQAFQKAAQINPKNSHALANEALIHLQTGKPEKCVELCNRALEIEPDLKAAQHNKGLALLMLRKWAEGWDLYYKTLGIKCREKRNYGLPEWEGQPGKVLVYGEQGVGDEIMFASCLQDLAKTNDIVLDCDSRLESLFDRSFDFPVYGTRFKKECLWVESEAPDYQIAIGQLPYFYRKSEASFHGEPYLKPDPDQKIMWRALFDTFKGKKIGVAWRGGLQNTGEKKRSLELSDLKPVFDDQNTFISLEYKEVAKTDIDQYGLKSYPDITGKGQKIDGLAAMISQLDAVVTCCTTVVYIAGALGVPCFVLVPDKPGYRYHMKGNFPWYSSVQLIRKKDSWISAAKQAKKCLESL